MTEIAPFRNIANDANYKRKAIFEYIMTNPGIHFRALKKALNIENGVLQYHLDILLKRGQIKYIIDGNKKMFFPANYNMHNIGKRDYIINEIRRSYSMLSEKEKIIFEIILRKGPISLKDIAVLARIRSKRHVKPYLRNIERKMGIVILQYKVEGTIYCAIDFERYTRRIYQNPGVFNAP